MGKYLIISILYLLVGLLYLMREKRKVRLARERIKIRVHVNGTRGKSTVTGYIAAGLRAEGVRTVAKVTGEMPMLFYPDSHTEPIRRRGPARVHEQLKTIQTAAAMEAEAIVFECMSLNPENQRIESRAIAPTIYLITNIGEDHSEDMGVTMEERIESICSAIPPGGTVLTVTDENLPFIKTHASKRKAAVAVADDFSAGITLPPGVFKTNVNLALSALKLLGFDADSIKPAVIEYASMKANPVTNCEAGGYPVTFVNGFPVNDPPSAAKFVQYWKSIIPGEYNVSLIFNTRADRPERTRHFCRWLSDFEGIRNIVISGSHRSAAYRILQKTRNGGRLHILNSAVEMEELLGRIGAESGKRNLIFGIGNIAGAGYDIISFFKQQRENQSI